MRCPACLVQWSGEVRVGMENCDYDFIPQNETVK